MAGFSFEPKDGLYIACADGSFFQQIVSDTTFFPNGQRLGRFAISPDGQQLALSIHHTSPASPRRSSIQFLDLGSFSLTEVYSTDSSISVLDWSADGEYIGYLVFNEHHDDLEILHLDTLTTSRVMKGDLESDEEYYSGLVDWEIEDFRLLDLDWSPDGEHILYVVVLLGPQVGATPGQIADITCSSQTHVCTIDNKQLLNWGNLRGMAWAPDMSAIVAARGIWETGDQFLEFRQIDGRLLRQIDLTTSFPGAALSFVEDIALSPEGGRVAFIAREDAGPEDVYVLRLGDLTLTNLTEKFGNTSASQVEWLP
jgi:Tol biopolymer transport system component